MKRLFASVFLCVMVILTANISADLCKRKSPDRNDEPSTLSRLRVVGNAIVDDDCTPQVLRGVAVIDPYYMKVVYEDGPKEEPFRILAQRWKAKIIRVPVHPDLWSNTYLKHYVDSIVEWGNKYGMYIFIGYHAHGNAITGEVEKPDWRNEWPWRGNPYNPDKRLAISALKKMVTRYKDKPWVIYGTFNEPSYITWNRWRPVAEKLVDVIHAVDPRALVTVSGVDWGYDLSGVLSNPVNRDNVVYETHPYPVKGESWKSVVRTLSGKYPVFIGEWGFPERTHGTTKNYGKPLVNFASELGLGWTAWIWHFDWSPEMLISRYSYKPTEFGSLVFRSLRKVLVTSPNGGQKWKTGKRYAIRWNKGNVGTYVKIQLFKKGKHYRWITKKTRNDGKHAWRVPSSITTSAAYKIKITSTMNKKLTDSSDKNFTITK